MRLLLTIFLISSLWSCSASWHLRQAIRKGATQKVDTVHILVEIPVPEVRTDTVFKSVEGDTVIIEKDRLLVKYVRMPGDSVFIEGKCKADTIYKEVVTTVTNEIEAQKGFLFYLPWILIVVVLFIGALVFKRV